MEQAEAFLQFVANGKNEREISRLRNHFARHQTVLTHLALLSIYHQIFSVVQTANREHPADGHQASNNFTKHAALLLGTFLAKVDYKSLENEIRKKTHDLVKVVRQATDALFGQGKNGGKVR